MQSANNVINEYAGTNNPALLNWLKTSQPIWYYSAIVFFLAMIAFFCLAQLDSTTFQGVSTWAKPFKFALSLGVYLGTLCIFANYIPTAYLTSRRGRLLVWMPVIISAAELFYIAFKAATGEASHFNTTSTLSSALYSLMGIGAVCLVAVLLWMSALIVRHNNLSEPIVFSIVVGLILTFILGGGFGAYLGAQSSHWVGNATTDAAGLAFFKWSREVGDLRVAHFFGMHAMHAIPLFAYLLVQASNHIGFKAPPARVNHINKVLVIAFACAYTAFTYVTFIQAVQGQPFIA